MKKFDFSKAFGEIDSRYISEAEGEWREKKKGWTPSFWSRLAAACVILALISTVLSNPKVQAAIRNLALSIGETLGFQKGIESYTEILDTSKTDQGITTTLKEVILDDGMLLFEVHAEFDDSGKKQQGKSEKVQSFNNMGITLDREKTTINGQTLDIYENADYAPYSTEDLLNIDTDNYEKEYDSVMEYRFHEPTDLGKNPEVHLVLKTYESEDWTMKATAEFTFDFTISREEILKQTIHKELENISVPTEEGAVTLKDFSLNKITSSISAELPDKLIEYYDVEFRGKDSKGNKVRYELTHEVTDNTKNNIRNWSFETNFWNTYAIDNSETERPAIPDISSDYVDIQLYIRSIAIPDDSAKSSFSGDSSEAELGETTDEIQEVPDEDTVDAEDDVYAEEEGKECDAKTDDAEWEAVGDMIRINIK